jgi:hypothetical protein
MLIVIGLQGLVGCVYLLRNRPFGYLGRLGRTLGWIGLVLVVFVLVAASKAAMEFIAREDLPRYGKQLSIATAFLACNVVCLVAFFASMPSVVLGRITAHARGWVTFSGVGPARFDRSFPYILSAFVFAVTFSISYWSFDAVPHLDGIVYLFHARYFADGMISLPVPPVVAPFDYYLMDVNAGRWFSVNLPGWPAAMAVSVWIGAPWLLNPILAGIGILLLHRFVRVQTDLGIANLVTLLLAVSPWYLSISSTMLLHTFTLVLLLGAWVLLQLSKRKPGYLLAFIAGCFMGWLFLTRPLEGVYIGVMTGLWTVTFLSDRRHWRTVVMYGMGCLAVGVLFFFYNTALTGSPLTVPMTAYLDDLWGPGRNAIGFRADVGAPGWGNVDVFDGHSPIEALINFQQSLYELNMDLLGFGSASLLFPLVYMIWGRWTWFTGALALIVLVTVGLYALYWYVGGFYAGPRYWFMTLVPMLVFAALGIRRFIDLLSPAFPSAAIPGRVAMLLALMIFAGVAVFESWLAFNKYPGINGYHADYLAMSKNERFENALVFITSENGNEFGSAFWLNDFHPGATTPLFAIDMGAEVNRQVAEAYPGRSIFIVEGRSPGIASVSVIEGPVAAEALQ